MREIAVNIAEVSAHIKNSDLSRVKGYTVAAVFGVSQATLRRKMKLVDMSFDRAIQAERQRRVFEALDDNPNIGAKRLAVVAGFADPKAFYSAFRRWVGVSFVGYQKARK